MESGRTVLRFTVEHLAMMHAWLVDVQKDMDIHIYIIFNRYTTYIVHFVLFVSGCRPYRPRMDRVFFKSSWEVKHSYSKYPKQKLVRNFKFETLLSGYGWHCIVLH